MSMRCACVNLCTCVQCWKAQNKGVRSLELELKGVVSRPSWVLVNELWSSARVVLATNPSAISPIPRLGLWSVSKSKK